MNITRRGFLQGAIGLAGAGMTAALTVPALKTLLPPPVTRCNKDDAHETLTFKAEEGKLLIWPSFMLHGSKPYTGEKNRIIVSANADVEISI